MNKHDQQMTENYERNRHLVTVKKDLFGNWYFVDANGNKAQTIAKSGQLTETKHHKADKQPTVSVLEYQPDAESEEVSYVAHLNNFPNFNYNNNMPLKANNYTVDTYEALYQRQKLMADFNELLQYCKPLMVGTKATDGLKFFQNSLNKMKAHFAIYFSDKEHKYLREFLKQTYTELLPDRFKSIINIDKIVDQFIDEVAGLRQATINDNNENLKYIASQADVLSKETTSATSYALGFNVVDTVNTREQKSKNL